jgi:DNA-binding HxlR family transcriptional regulator
MCDYTESMQHPIDKSVSTFGKRWAGPILLELMSGKAHFNEILCAIPGLSPRTLSVRLHEYQNVGLIKKQNNGDKRPQTRYVLTEKGNEMRGLVRDIVGFSMKWHLALDSDN